MRLTLGIVAETLFDVELTDEAAIVGESLEVVLNYFMSPWRWFGVRSASPLPSTKRYRRHPADRRFDLRHHSPAARKRGRSRRPARHAASARDEESGEGMSDQQLRDECVTLFLAGHETTALVMTYTFYLLSQAPADERLRAELATVLGGRAPTASDVPRLPYTEWCIREAMRLYPPAWAIGREALADCEIGGYHVAKGTQLS